MNSGTRACLSRQIERTKPRVVIGGVLERGEAPLKELAYPHQGLELKESLREAKPLLHNNSPSPYQGEGDKGDRVIKRLKLRWLVT